MQSQFTVIIDSCAFYQAPLRDLLLETASRGFFRARWTKQIEAEWVKNLLANRSDIKEAQLKRTCDLINTSVLDCLVEDYEDLVGGIVLPDLNDAHVVAAAIKAQAQLLLRIIVPIFLLRYLKNTTLRFCILIHFFVIRLILTYPLFSLV